MSDKNSYIDGMPVSRFNIANSITLFRIGLVPVILICLFGQTVQSSISALVLFIIAAISDYLDGRIARKRGLHSEFGSFMDPLADKLLVGGIFIALVFIPGLHIPAWLVAAILFREVWVTIFRVVAIRRSHPMKTEYLGKIKTAFQMVSITVILSLMILDRTGRNIFFSGEKDSVLLHRTGFEKGDFGSGGVLSCIPLIFVSISAVLSFISLVQYMYNNRDLFRT